MLYRWPSQSYLRMRRTIFQVAPRQHAVPPLFLKTSIGCKHRTSNDNSYWLVDKLLQKKRQFLLASRLTLTNNTTFDHTFSSHAHILLLTLKRYFSNSMTNKFPNAEPMSFLVIWMYFWWTISTMVILLKNLTFFLDIYTPNGATLEFSLCFIQGVYYFLLHS